MTKAVDQTSRGQTSRGIAGQASFPWHQLLSDLPLLAELVCPQECLWCETLLPEYSDARDKFCNTCAEQIVSDYYRCRCCATPLPPVLPNEDCHRCRKEKFRYDQVVTLGPYRELLSQLVVRLKKPNQNALSHAIARQMAQALRDQVPELLERARNEPCWIVPVPNHWTHAFSGAANTAYRLADRVSRELRVPCLIGKVRRIRRTDKQGMLSWSERRQNVRAAFQIHSAKELIGSHVILVDDVLTSGATCSEIARQLKRHKVHSVTVLVAARGTGSKETLLDESTLEKDDGQRTRT